MSKRNTVRRELKKRLSETKASLNYSKRSSWVDDDMFSVYGYPRGYDKQKVEERTKQYELNLKNDIEQIEFILWCLDNKNAIDSRRKLMIENNYV